MSQFDIMTGRLSNNFYVKLPILHYFRKNSSWYWKSYLGLLISKRKTKPLQGHFVFFLSVCTSARLSVRMPAARLIVCPSVRPSFYPVCLLVYLSVRLPVWPPLCSVSPPVRLSVCLPIRLSVRLFIRLCVCPSVCFSVYLSVCQALFSQKRIQILSLY